ncbi:hypothetical protein M758_5G176700 [Ceratodon purpureus]|uniref:Uncharacterized protein n=1 Tax=Ceratodon purpureus TaxID=3225 RepID=A0A8T0I4I6_CERPU|nr:hypothetical protein KC19_5G183700 [Ceratodon purpureus]KAG0617251.1 hypothetical protein M758_5G176700 [Ceratodon purpureus]
MDALCARWRFVIITLLLLGKARPYLGAEAEAGMDVNIRSRGSKPKGSEL